MTRHDPSLCETLHPGKTCLDSAHDTIDALMARGGTAAAGDEGLRAHIESATGSMRSAVEVGPDCYTEEGWHALCVRLLAALDATPAPTEDPAPSQDTLRAACVLDPAESMALTVAWHQVERGDEPTPNVAAVCVVALERIRLAALAATTPEAIGRDGGTV